MVALTNRGRRRRSGRRLAFLLGAGLLGAGLLGAGLWLALGAYPAMAQAPASTPAKADAESRVALVIGNGAYQGGAALANPVNDARAVGAKLKALGFEVISVENGTKQQMERALESFSSKLGPNAISLFYYAGHGMQVNSHNYLLPVDAQISTEQTVRLETVDVDAVIDQMATAKSRVNLVILDACRNNPYERRFRGQSGGLASIEAPTGTMIAYATSPGKVAADGEGKNGLYTAELLAAMDVPGAKVEDVFKRVRARVTEKSKGDQTPWESTSLTGDFYFNGPTTLIVSPSPAGTPADRDIVFWTSVKDSHDQAQIQTYLDQFPQGTFAGLAKVMLEELKRSQLAALPAKPATAAAPAAEPALPIEEIEGAYVTVKRANLREKPLADAKLVKALEPGVALKVTGKVKDTSWYRVASADGKLNGFVFGDAIQDVKAAEEAEWQRVKDAKESNTVAGFLKRYPAGVYAEQAKTLRDTLAKAEKQALALPPAAAVQPPPAAARVQAAPAGVPAQAARASASATPPTRRFDDPMVQGVALDFCRAQARDCGKPAADAFCQSQGFAMATDFTTRPNAPPTRIISSGQVCDNERCARLASVTCGNGSAGAAPPGQARSATLEYGTNRRGLDMRNLTLPNGTPEMCRDACLADPSCRAFTFVQPGRQSPDARCWLKHDVPQAISAPCCVSGVVN